MPDHSTDIRKCIVIYTYRERRKYSAHLIPLGSSEGADRIEPHGTRHHSNILEKWSRCSKGD